jgi:hypothetical protein
MTVTVTAGAALSVTICCAEEPTRYIGRGHLGQPRAHVPAVLTIPSSKTVNAAELVLDARRCSLLAHSQA